MRIIYWSSDVCSSDRHGEPHELACLASHRLLAASHQTPWRLHGPEGAVVLPVESVIRTNSSEVVREAMLAGIEIALRSSWDVAAELKSGALRVVLPDYGGGKGAAQMPGEPKRRVKTPTVPPILPFPTRLSRPSPPFERGRTPPPADLAGI